MSCFKLFVFAVIGITACVCAGVSITPHPLPCSYRIIVNTPAEFSSCGEYFDHIFVNNNNYMKIVSYCGLGCTTELLRKDGDAVSLHVNNLGCFSSNKTQADFETSFNRALHNYITALDCETIYDIVVNGENHKVCERTEDDGTVSNYTYDSENYLVTIENIENGRAKMRKYIKYEMLVYADQFTMSTGYCSIRSGCDAIAYTIPTEGICPRTTMTPHELPCSYHITTHRADVNSDNTTENIYVNKNYIKRSVCSNNNCQQTVMRKDDGVISYHDFYSSICFSQNKTQADYDSFFNEHLYDIVSTLECSKIYDIVVDGENRKVCERVEGGYTYTYTCNYTYNSDNYLIEINCSEDGNMIMNKTISYELYASPEQVTLSSESCGNLYNNCDAIACTVPTKGTCEDPVDPDTDDEPDTNDEWEIRIEFDGMNLDASKFNTSEVVDIIHRMTGVDANKLSIEVNSDDNGKVKGLVILVSNKKTAINVFDVLSGCSTANSGKPCEGVLQYTVSASISKKNVFVEEESCFFEVSIISMLLLMMMSIMVFFM